MAGIGGLKGQPVPSLRSRVWGATLRVHLLQLVERLLLPAVLDLDHGIGKTRLELGG